jgi:hypothetical protein
MNSLASTPIAASALSDEPPGRGYGRRARARLRIAARLLRLAVNATPESDEHCSRVLARIRQLSVERQDALRALVDWVESYEATEAAPPANPARRRM